MNTQETQGFAASLRSGRNARKQNANLAPLSKGALIMQIAEKLKPGLEKMLEGARNEEGQPVQPARIRGIALNMAQDMVNAAMAS